MQKRYFFVCLIFYTLLMYSSCLMHRTLFSLAGGSVFTVTSALAGRSMAQYIFWQKKMLNFMKTKTGSINLGATVHSYARIHMPLCNQDVLSAPSYRHPSSGLPIGRCGVSLPSAEKRWTPGSSSWLLGPQSQLQRVSNSGIKIHF